jgi:hypothetical protein
MRNIFLKALAFYLVKQLCFHFLTPDTQTHFTAETAKLAEKTIRNLCVLGGETRFVFPAGYSGPP